MGQTDWDMVKEVLKKKGFSSSQILEIYGAISEVAFEREVKYLKL